MNVELRKVLYNISALSDLGNEVTSADHFQTKIRSVLYVIMGTFIAVKGAILSYDKEQDALLTITEKAFGHEWPQRLAVGRAQIEEFTRNDPHRVGNGGSTEALAPWLQEIQHAGARVFVPLWTREQFVGALVLSDKIGSEEYDQEDFDLLRVIAQQIAITLQNHELFLDLTAQVDENRRLYDQMRRIYHDTIQAFAAAIDAKDVYTRNHSYRVARYVVAIGHELGWDEATIEGLYIAGLLHDVGKIILRDEVLKKKSSLSVAELAEVRRHSTLSFDIISKIKFPWKNIVNTVRHHHERMDGQGYPDALRGNELSDEEKVLILADSFDAMTTDRPYRKRMDLQTALEELSRHVGTQFDARITTAFCRVLEKEINDALPHPEIIPHLDKNFDPAIITALLHAITAELSARPDATAR